MAKNQKKERKTCVIYTRVSTAIQVDGYSLKAQEEVLRAEAAHRGYEVLKVYPDEGKSGKNIKGRPRFQEMIEDIQNPEMETPDYVYVFKLSRFGRNAADTLSSLQFLEDYGVNLLAVEDSIDSAGAAGKLLIAVYAAVAEAERENIHTQTMAGRWQKAKEGGWNGGFAPYGYKLVEGKLEIEEDEAELVREIYRMFTEGSIGMNAIAKRLNNRGLKKKVRYSKNTDRITATFVKSVLDNPIYAGYLPYGRRKTEKIDGTRNEFHVVKQAEYEKYEGKHEAIISRDIWEIAHEKRVRTGIGNVKTHSLEHCHILSGILKCPICGASMYGNVNRKKKKDGSGYYLDSWYYVCKNRKTVGGKPCNFKQYVRQENVNDEVLAVIKEVFNKEAVNEALAKDFLAENFDIDKLKEELKVLLEHKKELEAKKDKLLSKIADMDATDPMYDDLYENYDRLVRDFISQLKELEIQIKEARVNIDTNGARMESVENLAKVVARVWDDLSELPQEQVKEFLNCFLAEVHILPEPDVVDGVKYWVKSVRFKVPFKKGTPEEYDTLELKRTFQPNEVHVETVCLLTRE